MPRESWPDAESYDKRAHHLAELFKKNFKKFESGASAALIAAGPKWDGISRRCEASVHLIGGFRIREAIPSK